MKRITFTFLIVFLICPFLYSQSTTLSQSQQDKIKSALTRISMADAIVPNMVFNGMTFNEIQKLFSKQRISMNYTHGNVYVENYGDEYSIQCRVGNYIIFFSGPEFTNPVVIGFAKYGDPNIYYNEL